MPSPAATFVWSSSPSSAPSSQTCCWCWAVHSWLEASVTSPRASTSRCVRLQNNRQFVWIQKDCVETLQATRHACERLVTLKPVFQVWLDLFELHGMTKCSPGPFLKKRRNIRARATLILVWPGLVLKRSRSNGKHLTAHQMKLPSLITTETSPAGEVNPACFSPHPTGPGLDCETTKPLTNSHKT